MGHVHLCWVCDHIRIWQVMLLNSELGFHLDYTCATVTINWLLLGWVTLCKQVNLLDI